MNTATLTPTEAAAFWAFFGGIIGVFAIGALIFYVLTVIAAWKIFEKAGEPGWKALIPIYNLYIMYKIVGMKGWFWATLIVSFVGSIITTANSAPNLYVSSSGEILAYNYAANPLVIIVSIIMVVVAVWSGILFAWRLSKVFGHGAGFFIGLLLLSNVFWLILGFGKSKYNKKLYKQWTE